MRSRRACAWKSGPVSMRTMWLLYASEMEGRVRRLCGSVGGADGAVAAEGGHAHGGAAAEEGEGCLHALADDAGAAGAGPRRGRWAALGGGGAGEGLGDFEEGHAELEEGAVEQRGLLGERLPLVFSARMASMSMLWRAPMRSTWGCWPSWVLPPSCMMAVHVDGLDELVEAHGGWVVHAGVGGADGGVEAVGGLLVGDAGPARSARR